MEKLDTALNDYFKHFHKTRDKWTDLLKKSEKSVRVLCNQLEQLQLIKGVKDDTVNLFKIPYLKDNLIGKICGSIESEVKLVESTVVKECSMINQDTYSKLEILRRFVEQVDGLLDNACPTRPSSVQLIEWAEDIYQYYYNLYTQMLCTLYLLNYDDPNSLNKLKQAFTEDSELLDHIQTILAYTQFMVTEN